MPIVKKLRLRLMRAIGMIGEDIILLVHIESNLVAFEQRMMLNMGFSRQRGLLSLV